MQVSLCPWSTQPPETPEEHLSRHQLKLTSVFYTCEKATRSYSRTKKKKKKIKALENIRQLRCQQQFNSSTGSCRLHLCKIRRSYINKEGHIPLSFLNSTHQPWLVRLDFICLFDICWFLLVCLFCGFFPLQLFSMKNILGTLVRKTQKGG